MRAEACVGALMEALEYEAAERDSAAGPEGVLHLAAWEARLPDGLNMESFVPRLGVLRSPDTAVPVARCTDVASQRRVWVPAELVFMPGYEGDAQRLFGSSSNGLASGNSLAEATLHALLEVLERDALAMNRARDASERVGTEALPPPFTQWATSWLQRGVQLLVRHVPNEFGMPCFEAWLHEPGSLDVNLARGSGLHLDREIALSRAITEAAQSRLSLIHGGRDDITDFFSKYRRMSARALQAADARVLAVMEDKNREIAYTQVPTVACGSPSAALRWLLERLADRGFRHVLRRRITRGSETLAQRGLHVVKVVVPRCEHVGSGHARVGQRLMSRIAA